MKLYNLPVTDRLNEEQAKCLTYQYLNNIIQIILTAAERGIEGTLKAIISRKDTINIVFGDEIEKLQDIYF